MIDLFFRQVGEGRHDGGEAFDDLELGLLDRVAEIGFVGGDFCFIHEDLCRAEDALEIGS